MSSSMAYNGGLTAEQFLFYEIRIVAKTYADGKTVDEIIAIIKRDKRRHWQLLTVSSKV